jgi:hypothetical protein
LQGILYHNAALRSGGGSALAQALLGEDPQVFLNEVARVEYAVQQRELEIEGRMRDAKNARERSKLQKEKMRALEQEEFLRNHDSIKVLTQDEVDQLNACRPHDDQLQLSSSGLLLHHCACPSCPLYLKDLRTTRDRLAGGTRRNGLFKHLALYYQPDSHRYEIKGFHRILHLRPVGAFLRERGACARDLMQEALGKDAGSETLKAQNAFVQEILELYEAALHPLRLTAYDREYTVQFVVDHFRQQLKALVRTQS